ncbi:MAG: enoyl-CoA hydratase/isomerase family protein [Rhodospirillales bacterium]|nr:enoyl-CoA hydratase/isomerase family protein [Rhodospirillales bacterium]
MSDFDRIDLAIDRGVARITFDHAAKRNAFDAPMLAALVAALERVAGSTEARVAVLAGRGGFSAGADFDALTQGGDFAPRMVELDRAFTRAVAALKNLPQPVIGGLQGACMGGALQLALACDFCLAADDLAIGIPAVKLGIVYPLASLAELEKRIGAPAAKLFLMRAEPVDAAEALRLGLVERVVPAQGFETALAELARTLAGQPPNTLRAYTRVIDALGAGHRGQAEEARDQAYASGEMAEKLAAVRAKRAKATGGNGA